MKGCFSLLFGVIVVSMLFSTPAYAHPGNTDSSGGHTCRTNCHEWGLNYGDYHYHDSYGGGGGTYEEGYDLGYEYSYSYTSECEEEYEWWWEGSQAFGDGYEQGIADGHEEGLEVCYMNSYNSGYEWGYSDYQEGLEYDGTTVIYDEITFEEGYADGWNDSESEDTAQAEETEEVVSVTSNSTDNDSDNDHVLNSSQEQTVYEKGYSEGHWDATNEYIFEDYERGFTEEELSLFQKGYYAGWVEGGGGGSLETIWYEGITFFTSHPLLVILSLIGVLWGIRTLLQKKPNTAHTNIASKVVNILLWTGFLVLLYYLVS
ncbi:YHYH domain-containing protein [Cytobacillus sp. FJAT-54145]|uniref:YHYH domain-containing protein n=1 Tax=Cytobacillus spartinae TaxID=3299023 RepID=A0ABW6KEA7_9BACI